MQMTGRQFAERAEHPDFSGDSEAIRTLDLLLRRQLLYPAELRNQ